MYETRGSICKSCMRFPIVFFVSVEERENTGELVLLVTAVGFAFGAGKRFTKGGRVPRYLR